MTARRGAGEGSIHYREDRKTWVGQVDLGWSEGKRQRRTYTGKTRAEVRDRMTAALDNHRRGIVLTGGQQTLESYIRTWLADQPIAMGQDDHGLRPGTARRYRLFIEQDIIPALGKVTLERLTPSHVQGLLNARLKGSATRRPAAPATVRQLRAVFAKALHDAQRLEVIVRNVAALTKAPKVVQQDRPIMTPSQAKAFLEVIKGDRLEALYLLAIATGAREGELLGLTWDNVDLENRRLHISQGLQRIEGKLTLMPTKTPKSKRTIRLPELAVAALQAHRGRQATEELEALTWHGAPMVFTTKHGQPLDGSTVCHMFQDLLASEGLPRMRFHDLRHCAASLMAATGVPARVAMEVLGHSQIATTLNIYTQVLPNLLDEAATAMDVALGG